MPPDGPEPLRRPNRGLAVPLETTHPIRPRHELLAIERALRRTPGTTERTLAMREAVEQASPATQNTLMRIQQTR